MTWARIINMNNLTGPLDDFGAIAALDDALCLVQRLLAGGSMRTSTRFEIGRARMTGGSLRTSTRTEMGRARMTYRVTYRVP